MAAATIFGDRLLVVATVAGEPGSGKALGWRSLIDFQPRLAIARSRLTSRSAPLGVVGGVVRAVAIPAVDLDRELPAKHDDVGGDGATDMPSVLGADHNRLPCGKPFAREKQTERVDDRSLDLASGNLRGVHQTSRRMDTVEPFVPSAGAAVHATGGHLRWRGLDRAVPRPAFRASPVEPQR